MPETRGGHPVGETANVKPPTRPGPPREKATVEPAEKRDGQAPEKR